MTDLELETLTGLRWADLAIPVAYGLGAFSALVAVWVVLTVVEAWLDKHWPLEAAHRAPRRELSQRYGDKHGDV